MLAAGSTCRGDIIGLMSRSRRWDQQNAERIVGTILQGVVVPRDVDGAPSGTHDFDVNLSDGRVVGVEVVRFTDQGRLQQTAEIRRRAWWFSELSSAWHLSFDSGARIDRLHDGVADLLRLIEQAGLTRLRTVVSSTSTADDATKDAVDRLREMGIVALIALPELPPGEVIAAPFDYGGATGPDLVSSMIEQMSTRKGPKLARAEADERHLFIWVEWAQHATLAALAFVALTPPHPVLPDPVDAVWVVEALFPARVLSYRSNHGWTDHGEWTDDGPGLDPNPSSSSA